MHSLRQAKSFARFMLVWFVMSLGVASASSLVSPKAMEMVCTAGGVIKLVPSDSNNAYSHEHTMPDCAMCLLTGLPPAPKGAALEKPSALAHALHPIAAALIVSATAPPLPFRGPPAL